MTIFMQKGTYSMCTREDPNEHAHLIMFSTIRSMNPGKSDDQSVHEIHAMTAILV